MWDIAIFRPIMVKMLCFKNYFVLKVPLACQLCRSCLCYCIQMKVHLFGFHLRPKTAEYLHRYGNHLYLCDPYPQNIVLSKALNGSVIIIIYEFCVHLWGFIVTYSQFMTLADNVMYKYSILCEKLSLMKLFSW